VDQGMKDILENLRTAGIVMLLSLSAVAIVIDSRTPITVDPSANQPVIAPLEGTTLGRARFRASNCASCHGEGGQGGVVNPNYISNTIPALDSLADRMMLYEPEDAEMAISILTSGVQPTDQPFRTYPRFMAQLESVRDTIRAGRTAGRLDPDGETPVNMPAWGSNLNSREIDAIIAYLISLYEWDA